MATFSERIKSLRLSKNKTQAELAEYLKVSKSIISMYERGERVPGYEMQEALADYFNVDLDYLMGRSDRTAVVFKANGNELLTIVYHHYTNAYSRAFQGFQNQEIYPD